MVLYHIRWRRQDSSNDRNTLHLIIEPLFAIETPASEIQPDLVCEITRTILFVNFPTTKPVKALIKEIAQDYIVLATDA